jgi:hypothetical protein
MSTSKSDDQSLVSRFVRTGELHGDAQSDRLAGAMQKDSCRHVMDLADAFDRCREWSRCGAVPAWQRVREGLLKTADRLVLQVSESGRLAARWGENLIEAAFPLQATGGRELAAVALGDRDDLRLHRCSVKIGRGDSSVGCELRFHVGKDGLITVELHADAPTKGRWLAELWSGTDLLQQLPLESGVVAFSRRLSLGCYRIVLRGGDKQHEIAMDVA